MTDTQRTLDGDTVAPQLLTLRRRARHRLGIDREQAADLFPKGTHDDGDTRPWRHLFDALAAKDMTLADRDEVVADLLKYPAGRASALDPSLLAVAISSLWHDFDDIDRALKNLQFFENDEEIPEPVIDAAKPPHKWDTPGLDPTDIDRTACVSCGTTYFDIEVADRGREWVDESGRVEREGLKHLDDAGSTPHNTALSGDDPEDAGIWQCHHCYTRMTEVGPRELRVETDDETHVYQFWTQGDVVLDASIYPHYDAEDFHRTGPTAVRDTIYAMVRGDISREQAERAIAAHFEC